MLREIRIRSLGVIDDALLEFSPGLNVVTGETGAGKTMVVQGLGLLLGGRAAPALVREGASRTSVEGVVELGADSPALERANAAGADPQEALRDGLVIVRTVASAGRSRAHVGGCAAPIGVLSEIGATTVAVHGQADQWRLLQPEQHRVVLDAFGGTKLAAAATAYTATYDEWVAARAELATLTDRARDRAQRLAMLMRGLEEIEAAAPQPNEDVDLAAEAERLSHVDALRDGASLAHQALSGDEDAAQETAYIGDLVARARAGLSGLLDHDRQLADFDARLRELGILAADLAVDVAAYLSDLDADPARLVVVQERRAQLGALQRTYGDTIDDVLLWGKNAAAEADALAGGGERVETLRQRLAELTPQLHAAATSLSAARAAAATKLGKAVTAELAHLAMGSARVVVEVQTPAAPKGQRPDTDFHPHGVDRVEILLAANAGATPRSVAKAASGGELSRVMLALEVVTAGAHTDELPTFVFDEVDAGVGGAAALDVGSRLHALAKHTQVIVVTHLAQVAAYADNHLVVVKQDDGHVTQSGVRTVSKDDRLAELARMLGGVSDSKAARQHAKELLATAAGRG